MKGLYHLLEKEERELLKKFYECHDLMEKLLDKSKDDPDYKAMDNLIKRLEDYIIDKNQNLI